MYWENSRAEGLTSAVAVKKVEVVIVPAGKLVHFESRIHLNLLLVQKELGRNRHSTKVHLSLRLSNTLKSDTVLKVKF